MIEEIAREEVVKNVWMSLEPDSTAANLRLWIAALRSEEYKQGHKKLRNGDLFCCLGVACDIMNPDAWEYKGEESYVWDCGNPNYVSFDMEMREAFGLSRYREGELIKLNDELRYSFDQIANYIEKKILPDYIELARIQELKILSNEN